MFKIFKGYHACSKFLICRMKTIKTMMISGNGIMRNLLTFQKLPWLNISEPSSLVCGTVFSRDASDFHLLHFPAQETGSWVSLYVWIGKAANFFDAFPTWSSHNCCPGSTKGVGQQQINGRGGEIETSVPPAISLRLRNGRRIHVYHHYQW